MRKISVPTTDGPRVVDSIWERDGLAVTRATHTGQDAWTITHLQSGWSVRTGLDRYQAVALANRLIGVGDWHRTGRQMLSDEAFYQKVWEILTEGRGDFQEAKQHATTVLDSGWDTIS